MIGLEGLEGVFCEVGNGTMEMGKIVMGYFVKWKGVQVSLLDSSGSGQELT